MFTLGNWFFVGFRVFITIVISLSIAWYNDWDVEGWLLYGMINIVISCVVLCGICYGIR